MRPLLEGRQLPVPHLVEDPSGITVTKVVDPAAAAQGREALSPPAQA